jgi:hypothetical protein
MNIKRVKPFCLVAMEYNLNWMRNKKRTKESLINSSDNIIQQSLLVAATNFVCTFPLNVFSLRCFLKMQI